MKHYYKDILVHGAQIVRYLKVRVSNQFYILVPEVPCEPCTDSQYDDVLITHTFATSILLLLTSLLYRASMNQMTIS